MKSFNYFFFLIPRTNSPLVDAIPAGNRQTAAVSCEESAARNPSQIAPRTEIAFRKLRSVHPPSPVKASLPAIERAIRRTAEPLFSLPLPP